MQLRQSSSRGDANDGYRPFARWRPRRLATYLGFGIADGAVVVCSYLAAFILKFEGDIPQLNVQAFPITFAGLIAVYVTTNLVLKMYWRGWRYASLHDGVALAVAVGIGTTIAAVAAGLLFPWPRPLPLSVIPIGGLFTFLGMGVLRFRHRLVQELLTVLSPTMRSRLLIIGAGQAGQWLARELLYTPALGFQPVCFVDDDTGKRGQRIHGLQVAGNRRDIKRLVQQHGVDVVAFAIPSADAETRREILAECELTSARVKIMPGIPDLLTSESDKLMFRDLRLEDLLGRSPVLFLGQEQHAGLRGSVLITGAAGSIGSELARQLVALGSQRIILLDTNESGLFDLVNELQASRTATGSRLEVTIADVTRAGRIERLFDQMRPAAVFHAAAYKHVPLMEMHPEEAVCTNVLGTLNVCRAAESAGCERFVLISTDKAVAPANVMGATKHLAERIVEAYAADSQTRYCSVRFGNVLGSRGSVVPTFSRQILAGGPVTLTHRDVTRFFMTIPEAANLIIEAACQATGGESFILDMGEPVSIADLAHKMIRLQGLRPGTDIEIQEVGLRPGEKLHETLTSATETMLSTQHPRVFQIRDAAKPRLSRGDVERLGQQLWALAERADTPTIVQTLFALVGQDSQVNPAGGDKAERDRVRTPAAGTWQVKPVPEMGVRRIS